MTTPRMTTPLPSYMFRLREGTNPKRDSCMNCGWKYPTNPHNNSFYCPNPSCRLPHVCVRPGRHRFMCCLPDPTARSTICYNCENAIFEIQPIPPDHVKRPNVCPPSFRCPNCLFLYYYYRPIFTDDVVVPSPPPIPTPPPPPIITPTVGVDDDDGYNFFLEEEDIYESCSICTDFLFMNEFSCVYYLQRCGHGFHKDCILEWLEDSTTCPLCREECYDCDGGSESEVYLSVKEVVSASMRRENRRRQSATTGSNDHSRVIDDYGDTLMADAS